MSEDQNQGKATGFYEKKGMARYTLILTETHKTKLKGVATAYGISQGDVVEILLDQMNTNHLDPFLKAKRNSKIDGRSPGGLTQTAVIKKFKGATPEQLAAIAAILNQGKPQG